MKLTPEVLAAAQSYINPLKDRELNLRGHKIPAIENLDTQDQHDTIDFTDNALTSLSNLPRLHRLHTLLLSSNRISHIAPSIATSAPRLRTIVLTNNAITELADLKPLGTLKHLEFLSLLGNPVREKKNYREYVIWTCSSSLRVLDFQRIKEKERKTCKTLFVTAEGLPTALAASIEASASAQPTLTFTPGGEDANADDRPGAKAGAAGRLMTAEERARVREAIARASSAEEIKRLERALRDVLSQAGKSALSLSMAVIGALLGTQNGRDVEIVNTFELVLQDDQDATYDGSSLPHSARPEIDHGFLSTRRDQYKSVFPALEFLGWYTYAPVPSQLHVDLSEQFSSYSSSPLLLMLTPTSKEASGSQLETLPILAFEPTIEIKDRKSRTVFAEVSWKIQTGEAERIAVDWTARGGGGEDDITSHLQTQRAAYKMLHDRIVILVQYVAEVLDSKAPKNHEVLRALAALVASLPASESSAFRDEFSTEYADVQLTSYLSFLTKSASILNDIVDKHILIAGRGDEAGRGGSRRRGMGMGGPMSSLTADRSIDHRSPNDGRKSSTWYKVVPPVIFFTLEVGRRIPNIAAEAIKTTFQLRVLYHLLFSYIFGATLWGSFIAGFIAFRALPRQQFGLLQSRVFPVFFKSATAVTTTLLGIWAATHEEVRADIFNLNSSAVAQAWILALAVVSQTSNLIYLGPMTSEIMFERHKLERAEKKQYDDPTASARMKELNKKFGALHGISSLANLFSFFCLLAHGIQIGSLTTAL
ncbi:COP9 signalosome complex subunit 6 [Ceratobasidium theobromae]|uniref:U2 small nuclear ribonucleoprotein A' n=1 Tax=Ceratobasidium theobromae TaxID=1582974 RepID=A0A5N5QM40_9AGAM|nr:COP9 signalosome complex subunit 6 [Ceratobasidium theobromae]